MWPKRSAIAGWRRGLEAKALITYCETMKNVTVSLDDATYRNARVRAAEMGRSLSALVREYLRQLGSAESEFERMHKEELKLREKITRFSGNDLLSRDALHERRS